MKRRNCNQSKAENPNWGEKIYLGNTQSETKLITECFISSGPKVLKFEDSVVSYGGVVCGYSCTTI